MAMIGDCLTVEQRKGIAALLDTTDASAAAKAACVKPTTLKKWQSEPVFMAQLNAARMARAIQLATDTAIDAMTSGDGRETRLRAAEAVLAALPTLCKLLGMAEQKEKHG
jgi:hypothetical protein